MHARPPQLGRRKLATAPPPEISATFSGSPQSTPEHSGLKRLIWIYFWLLLTEGALRKWILPGYANPLLIIRDPVVLLIYLAAINRNVFPMNGFVITTFILGVANSFAALFAGQDNILVTLYGLRTAFLHLPLIFIVPAVCTREDVEKFGSWFLITAIPMALLVLIQFRSSPNAWVNVGVGGTEGSQLTVGFGKIRPPGTFSFTSGLAIYLSIVAAFAFSYLLKKWTINRGTAVSAVFALGIMAAVSGSRGAIVSLVLILVAVFYISLTNRTFVGPGLRMVVIITITCAVLMLRHEIRQGITIHETRIDEGGGVQSGLIDRTLGGFLEAFHDWGNTPLLGQGIGLGTTAAGGLIYGQRSFVLAEGEWLRVVKESGPILGLIYLGMRVAIVFLLLSRARAAVDDENPLALLLSAAVCPLVLSGQFGVATILGFATFGAGLCLAAARQPEAEDQPATQGLGTPALVDGTRLVRGRSIYAERLHGR